MTDDVEALVREWLPLDDVAARLGVELRAVRQLLREHKLIGLKREGGLMVPSAFVEGGAVVKGLAGTLTVLADAGFSDAEAIRWLFTPDESLPGAPVQALAENRGTEVKRRAQALAF